MFGQHIREMLVDSNVVLQNPPSDSPKEMQNFDFDDREDAEPDAPESQGSGGRDKIFQGLSRTLNLHEAPKLLIVGVYPVYEAGVLSRFIEYTLSKPTTGVNFRPSFDGNKCLTWSNTS